MYIERTSAHWPKRCLFNENVPLDWKCANWMKKCLLPNMVLIEWKCAYWLKRYLLNENVPIDKKCVYWMKMCLLKSHNSLDINSSSYSFVNFFSFIFFRNTRNMWVFSKIVICKSSFLLLTSEKVHESSHTNGSNNNFEQFVHLVICSQFFLFHPS